jgi:hypothetical protein
VNKGKKEADAYRFRPLACPTVLYVGLASSDGSWEVSMTPSCCIMPKESVSLRRSTHLPSAKRRMVIPPTVICLPLGGMPLNLASCVARSVKRHATFSPSETTSSSVIRELGKAAHKAS